MKRTVCLVMAVLLIAATFCACGGKGIVGKWSTVQEGIEMTLEYKPDGTGSISAGGGMISIDFTYSVSGNKLTMTYEGEPATSEFAIKGDKLILDIEGETLEFTRK